MKINRFNGGINTRLDASLLESNEATVLSNVNTTANTLLSAKNYTDGNAEVRGYFYKFNDAWVSSYLERSYVEYDSKLYFTEKDNKPQKFDGTAKKNLGIVGPTAPLVAIEAPATVTFTSVNSVSAQGVNAQAMYFSDDGYRLYILDATNDAIDQYGLSIAWDITTAVYATKTFSVSAQEASPTGMTFKPDGSRVYVIGGDREVYQYNLSTAWDITTAVYTTLISAAAQVTTPQSLHFSADGTKLFILDDTGDKVVMYTLSTPYLMSSATYTNQLALTVDTAPRGLAFNTLGTRMYVVGTTTDKVYEYSLSTAWDLTTTVYYNELANIVVQTSDVTDLVFSPDMANMYVIAETGAAEINQYHVNRISSVDSVIQYVYTYYNSVDDVESVPSEPSAELNLRAVRGALVSGFLLSEDPQVDKIRLYRIGDNVTEFELVVEYAVSASNYTDGVPTTELTSIMESSFYYPPLVGAKYLTEAHGTLFYALGNKLYFSLPGQPDYWPAEYFLKFSREITGILPYSEGILVFGLSRTDIVYGTTAADFRIKDISRDIGCTNHYSCKYTGGIPIWQSLEGFCTVQSGRMNILSKDKLGTQTFDLINTAVYDETYWACLTDGTLLAIDYRFNGLAFKKYALTEELANIYADGILYGVVNTDRLAILFTGADLPLSYTSPVFVEDGYSELKLYNNIYIKYAGTFTLTVLIDGVSVGDYTLTGGGYKDLKVPEDKQAGNSIQFIINGTGVVHEIEYKVQGRQNGR